MCQTKIVVTTISCQNKGFDILICIYYTKLMFCNDFKFIDITKPFNKDT